MKSIGKTFLLFTIFTMNIVNVLNAEVGYDGHLNNNSPSDPFAGLKRIGIEDCYPPASVEIKKSGMTTTYILKTNSSSDLITPKIKYVTPDHDNDHNSRPFEEYVPNDAICFPRHKITMTITEKTQAQEKVENQKIKDETFVQKPTPLDIVNMSSQNKSLMNKLSKVAANAKDINEFQTQFCREGGLSTYTIRSNSGSLCSIASLARIAVETCKGRSNFNSSGCYRNAQTAPKYKELIDLEIALSSSNTVREFVCNNKNKFPTSIKNLADKKCPGI